jgi:chaperonin GroES
VNARQKIKPLGDRVVVKPEPKEGTVIAVGRGRLLNDGTHATMELHEGEPVLFARYGGTEVLRDDEVYLVLCESDVLGVLA